MLISGLIKALDWADSLRAVMAISRALEWRTGLKAGDVALNIGQGANVSDWYVRNGYYRIGAQSYQSDTGISVTFDRALECGPVYAGVKIISEDMGALPFHVYERSRDRKTVERAYDSPLYQTLHDLANPETSAGEFVEALTAHALLTGNGYARIERYGARKERIKLWPWQPQNMQTGRNANDALFYLHRENSIDKAYPREQVFHLRGFTLDGISGDNVLSRARHTIGLTRAAEQYAGSYFASSSMVHLVLERPAGAPTVGKEGIEAIKEGWKKWHAGLKNAWEPAILQEGMQAKLLSPKHSETQLIEQREFQILEACRLLRLPPSKLADFKYGIKANVEQQGIDYIQMSLAPWQDRWRRAVHRCLLTVDEQLAGRIYAEHQTEALMRGDFATQSEGFRKLLEKGVYSINEVRRLLNLNPVKGGDEHFIQLNLSTVQQVAAGANLPNQGETGLLKVE